MQQQPLKQNELEQCNVQELFIILNLTTNLIRKG